MLSNGQLWTRPLIFKIRWTRLLSVVVYIYGHICGFLSRYAQLKEYTLLQKRWGGWGIGYSLKLGNFKLISAINTLSIFFEITDHYSTLVKAMAWCRQAKKHYLSQCWPRSLAPYGVTRPQLVNLDIANHYMWYEFVPVMAWCPLDNKPLTEPMMTKMKRAIWCHLATMISRKLDEKCVGQKVVGCV